MQVWILKRFCSDSAGYDFIDVFATRNNAINYVYNNCGSYEGIPTGAWAIHNETETQSEVWSEGWYIPFSERSRLEQPNFLVTRREVR